jgi:endonuclease/exonuclease/phosphatase family metal-dependent hydrolase
MKLRLLCIGGWSVVAALGLAACSDGGAGGGSGGTGNRGGKGGGPGSGGATAGGMGGASAGGSGGGASGAGGVGKGGTAGAGAGGAGAAGGAAGAGGTSGGGAGGAAGSSTGGTGGTAGAKDSGAPTPDGSAGSSTGGSGGAAGRGGAAGGGMVDARADNVDAPTGTGGASGASGDAGPPMCSPFSGGAPISVVVPPKGTAASLDVAAWNIEWFGDTANGPTNEDLQRDNVADVILGTDFDLWGLQEVVSTAQFDQVMAKLPGYKGFLSDNALVQQGSQWYTATEQKLGLVYKCSVATVESAKVILTSANNAFAGRPPLEVTLKVTLNGATIDLVVIVLHAKCCSDADSLTRRKDASDALKPYLDSTYPSQRVMVIGDFNDDLDTSITVGSPTPYANFLADSANYTFISKALTDSKTASTVSYSDTIDHHMTTNEMAASFIAGSIGVYNLTSIVTNYGASTTDHYPVLSRYHLP